MSFELGEKVADRYRVEAQLARGEIGEVYRVLDEETNAPLALKVQYPPSKDFAEFLTRCARAVEVSGYFGTRSAGFVRAHACGVLPDKGVWLAMDLVPEARALDLRDGERNYRLGLLVRAARRVAELHRLGIVHRALRPDAFLLDAEERVLLADFGLARLHGDPLESGEGSLDAWEAVLSYPHYLAPEQVRATYVDHRADIYALGVMLYEALVGSPPFRGSLSEVLDQQTLVRHGERPSPRPSQATHVPIELDQLCAEALHLETEQRLGEAHVFSDRLDAASTAGDSRRSGRIPLSAPLPEPPPGVRRVSAEDGTFLNEKDSSVLVWIPGGQVDGPGGPSRLAGFYAGKYPVTWGQYRHFCEVTQRDLAPARYPVDENHPVHNVSYADAEAYCAWAGLRLLREEEWRFAAQANTGQPYPWGEDEPSPTRCNWAGHPRHGRRRSAPVGSFPAGASPYGVLDLAGNVAEWTLTEEGRPDAAVLGGSFRSESTGCAIGVAEMLPKESSEGHVGFRVALSPQRATGR
ncbi:MAG: SUMF1/EgtB/PvdO family nonheme iron enzyme, partial [Planctomycetes bacterium]|nr:SUMF1/EgtB/PvdO family nonheme iron enzyme [Planctomycetota bacterium]